MDFWMALYTSIPWFTYLSCLLTYVFIMKKATKPGTPINGFNGLQWRLISVWQSLRGVVCATLSEKLSVTKTGLNKSTCCFDLNASQLFRKMNCQYMSSARQTYHNFHWNPCRNNDLWIKYCERFLEGQQLAPYRPLQQLIWPFSMTLWIAVNEKCLGPFDDSNFYFFNFCWILSISEPNFFTFAVLILSITSLLSCNTIFLLYKSIIID